MYKWRANECQITVSSDKVTDVQLAVSDDRGGKNTQHRALYDRVIQAQSPQMDTMSTNDVRQLERQQVLDRGKIMLYNVGEQWL